MIHRYRDLVIVFILLMACLGAFLIYDSLTNPSRSDGLDIIFGACCCSLALIMAGNLIVHLRDSAASEQHEQEKRSVRRVN